MIARASTPTRFASVAPWVSTLLRLVLGGVFLAAGSLKVIDPQASVQAVRAYQLLPEDLVLLVGWGLPFAEIAVGLVLVAGAVTRVAAATAAVALVVFVLAVASAWSRGLSIDCGCFGGGGAVAPGQTSYAGEVVRDGLFLLMALWLVWQPRSRLGFDAAQLEPATPLRQKAVGS